MRHRRNAPIAEPEKYPVEALHGVFHRVPAPREDVRFPRGWIGVHGAVTSNAQNGTDRAIPSNSDSEVGRKFIDGLLAYI